MYEHALCKMGDWKSQGVQRSTLQQERRLKGGEVQRPQLKQKKGSQWGGGGGEECHKNKTQCGGQ